MTSHRSYSPKKIKYKGRTFFKGEDGYYRDGQTTLHKFKYEAKYGGLLPCFHLHHKDGNKFNNNIKNLEAIPPAKHVLIHKELRRSWIFKDQTLLVFE